MITKLKRLFIIAFSMGLLGAPLMVPAMAVAADNNTIRAACEGVNLSADNITNTTAGNSTACDPGDTNGTNLTKLIKLVINIFSLIVGVVAVVMIIIGGLKYITSGGDSGNISGAKNTILYAIIGLVIVALAQFIVRFVLRQVGSTVNT